MANAAVFAKGSVHLDGSQGRQHVVTDAGTSQGKQVVVAPAGTLTILVESPAMAYFQTNGAILEGSFRLPQSEATKYAGKWIAVPSSNKAYASLTTFLTVASVMTGSTPAAPLTFTKPTIMDGKSVVGISGGLGPYATGFGKQVLYISTVAPYLPVAATQHPTSGTLPSEWHMSDYGKPVTVTAPANTIPITSVPGLP